MKLITINHYQAQIRAMTLRRLLGQRSMSVSDGRGNLVNSTAPESSKLTQIFLTVGPRTE